MLLKAHPLTLWLNFLGERTVFMLYLRQTCLSSIWYYCLCQLHTCIMLNEFILQVLWLFDTITINATLHGLRQMDSHLGTPMRITILMYLNLCEKVPVHHHLWDLCVALIAQIGNARLWRLSILLLLQTLELSFGCLPGFCYSSPCFCN